MATRRNTQTKTTVGCNIVAARDRLNLTQHELASALNTSISRVSGWERGEHMPRNLQAVADELFGGDITALFRAPDPEDVAA